MQYTFPQVAAAAALSGFIPFSTADYFYPPANYLLALQEAYAMMGGRMPPAASSALAKLAPPVSASGSSSTPEDKMQAGRGLTGSGRVGVDGSGGIMTSGLGSAFNGMANPFNFPWMKDNSAAAAASTSGERGSQGSSNYDQNGALDLSGNVLKRKYSATTSQGDQSLHATAAKRISPSGGLQGSSLQTGKHSADYSKRSSALGSAKSSSGDARTPPSESNAQHILAQQQQQRLLQQRYLAELSMRPPFFSPSAADVISRWTVDDVVKFVSEVDGCLKYAEVFRQLNVTGSALPFLTIDHMTQILGVQPEAAHSLRAAIDRILSHPSLAR